jgi:putative membrane protein
MICPSGGLCPPKVNANQIDNIMNRHVKGVALLLCSLPGALIACHSAGSSASTDTATSVTQPAATPAQDGTSKQDSSNITGPTSVVKGDADFMSAVADGGMTEIQASQAAQNMAASARVKDFAAMMVQDHGQWGDQLKSLAQSRNVTLPATPSDKHQTAIADLQKKTGVAFDKAYMKMMVHDHEGVVNDFEKAQGTIKDSALLSFVNNTLPHIKMHLDSAKAVEKGL